MNPHKAWRLHEALKNTRKPPKNADAEQYRRLLELALLKRLYGTRGGAR